MRSKQVTELERVEMPMKSTVFVRRGAMMLMLLVAIIVGSIIALQILPAEEMITRRGVEKTFDVELSQLREALDLAYYAGEMDPDTALGSDPIILATSPAAIQEAINKLHARGYLRSNKVKDPWVPQHRWGTAADQEFWVLTENFAEDASFEESVGGFISVSWIPMPDTTASADTSILQNMRIDSYPYENKLGLLASSSGSALRIDIK
ncbi:MAG TPA: hypothetical protein DCG57_06210 [Candidatus Riflebacteria bacterium]|jgi:hypothetical protein|nr:hypothetical protein [Candidatus Riflebacteria bacterium]